MILIATLGSHGDLNPYLALALELMRRGHRVRIATTPYHQGRIEALGIEFRPVRPFVTPSDRKIVEGTMDPRRGPEFLLREVVFPHLRDTHADTAAAAAGASLIVSHMLTFTAVCVAEQTGLPWASSVLAPLSFVSAHDPPVIGGYEWLNCLHALGPRFMSGFVSSVRASSMRWLAPYRELRRELGLSPGGNPIFEGQHSPHLVTALFSKILGEPQPDWPKASLQTGFLFHDELHSELSPELERFLDAGPPPIVFTLGTAAVHVAGDFYAQSAAAARALGRRAVFLIGSDAGNSRQGLEGAGTCVATYEPYARLFERAAAVVHQGGVGTTAQALRAGLPMLIVPFGNDQADNAARATRFGAARQVARAQYTWRRACYELGELLGDARYAERARLAARIIRDEDALTRTVAALERLL